MIDVTYPYIVSNKIAWVGEAQDTGAQTMLDKLIDVNLGNDNTSQVINESFINYLKEMGVYEKNADMDITNVIPLKNLWQGGGSPLLQVLPQEYPGRATYEKEWSGLEIDIENQTEKRVTYPATIKAYNNVGGGWEYTDDRGNIVDDDVNLLNILIQELSHAYQTNTSRIPEDYSGDPKRYNTKGTREYQAHSVIYPFLKHIYENEGGIVPDRQQDMQMFQFAREYMKNVE